MKKVMIVDNDSNWRLVLANVVRRAGHEVVVATNGVDAIKRAGEANPDLILMDLSLPMLNGAEITAILKADPATQKIPVVIQTAFGSSSLAEHAVEHGAAELLHKPVRIAEIDRVLCRYLAGNLPKVGARPTLASSSRTVTLTEGHQPQIDSRPA